MKKDFVSTSTEEFGEVVNENEKEWTIDEIHKRDFSIDDLITTLNVTDTLKRMYPNDEYVKVFEEIIRHEICQMFGGTIYED